MKAIAFLKALYSDIASFFNASVRRRIYLNEYSYLDLDKGVVCLNCNKKTMKHIIGKYTILNDSRFTKKGQGK